MEQIDKYVQTEGFYDNIDEWLEWDKNPRTREEIEELLAAEDYKTLKEILGTRLKFEESGIQGRMGAGFSRMNDLVVIQTTQGLSSYLESIDTIENLKNRGVTIGFDVRHNSQRFAHLTAVTFVNRGFRVCLFAEVCPLIFIPFCIKVNKCIAGIMITGSFGTKLDNGYRVYWENGVHLLPPHDKNIHEYILQNLEPAENAWDTTILEKNALVRNPLVQITGLYFNMLRRNTAYPEINKVSEKTITYTAMHGVGHRFMVEAFRAGNFNPLLPVKEQKDINPEFPTVNLPNISDEHSLEKAILAANDNWSRLILATDPDAQNFTVVERCVYSSNENEESADTEHHEFNCSQEKPDWQIFTGNELATLLSWWTFYSHRQKNPNEDLANMYILGTATSTKFLQSIAHTEGFNHVETPVGFKWIVNTAQELIIDEKCVLFGYSEPCDYMIGTNILEKDGIMGSLSVASLAAYLYNENMNLNSKLQELYSIYGNYINKIHSFTVDDRETFENIFSRLRNFSGEPNTYPTTLAEGEYIIASVQDYTTGFNSLNDEIILNPEPKYELVKFVLENGATVTITDCGTRSKIKYFVEMVDMPQEEDIEMYVEKTCNEIVDHVFKSVGIELLLSTEDSPLSESNEFLRLDKDSSVPDDTGFIQLVPDNSKIIKPILDSLLPVLENSEFPQPTKDPSEPVVDEILQLEEDTSEPVVDEILQLEEDTSEPVVDEILQLEEDTSEPVVDEILQLEEEPSAQENVDIPQETGDSSVPGNDEPPHQLAAGSSVNVNNETGPDETQVTEQNE